jgi:hypothetical protein
MAADSNDRSALELREARKTRNGLPGSLPVTANAFRFLAFMPIQRPFACTLGHRARDRKKLTEGLPTLLMSPSGTTLDTWQAANGPTIENRTTVSTAVLERLAYDTDYA